MSLRESKSSSPDDEELLNIDKILLRGRHEKFLLRLLSVLPGDSFCSLETSRMTIVMFVLSGLDVLGSLDKTVDEKRRGQLIEWIYSLQSGDGFRGSSFMNFKKSHSCENRCRSVEAYSGHVAMTYTALASLVILGDDLSRVNVVNVSQGLRVLQQEDGSFVASKEEAENDMRFVYCATAICKLINDWSGVDKDKLANFIVKSINYDGAFAQGPDLESHGGSTYCAVAALHLMDKMDVLSDKLRERATRWCVMRLHDGFQGRPNKNDDTCYTFWVGAALQLLTSSVDMTTNMIDRCTKYVLSTQDAIVGGMAKCPGETPDPLHTYLGLAGLSLGSSLGLRPVDPALNITQRAVQHLHKLHNYS